MNPLGAKRNKCKICAFYYTVGNISAKYRSKLSHVHLALMVPHSHVKESGLETILQPLIADLEMLSTEGFTISFDEAEHTSHAALATISCDNLSAHMIGRFSVSFNTGRICRFCMASHSEIQQKFCEDSFFLEQLKYINIT